MVVVKVITLVEFRTEQKHIKLTLESNGTKADQLVKGDVAFAVLGANSYLVCMGIWSG